MKTEIKVPAMGESISEATVGEILKANGSQVAVDDEILELETDKVNQVLYSPQAGVIEITVVHGDTVKIGQVIGFVDSDKKGEAPPATAPKTTPVKEEKKPEVAADSQGKVRNNKEEFIADVKSGVEKAVPKAEAPVVKTPPKVQAAPTVSSERETRRRMSKIRKVIANKLVDVQHTTAMLTTFNEVDMSEVMALREKYKESFLKAHGSKLGFMSFFVKASLSALKAFPDFNSYIDGDDIVHRDYYDVGIAVGTDKGVFVPIVRDCDQLTFAGIESAIEGYAKKAREGSLNIDDLQGGGFTITNGGVYGSLLSTPILNPNQSGILGMHKIEKRAVVVNDQVVIKPMMYLALSYDHRIVDGKEAVSFLVHIKNQLEDPSRLLLEI